MKVTVLSGIAFAALWILVKMIFYWTGGVVYDITPLVFVNMLCLMLAVAVGLFLHKRKQDEHENALGDIKSGMAAALPYTVIVSVFLYLYYSSIHPEYNAHKISEAHTEIKQMLDTPVGLQTTKDANPDFEVLTKEEIYSKLKQGPELFYNATTSMTIAMLAMLLLGTLYSIVIAIVYRKLIFL